VSQLELSAEERRMLDGADGRAAQKSMEILVALGEIYGARRMLPVTSVQVAGVSYDNLGEAGLEFLEEMAVDGRARVLATLNPAGMDIERFRELGIDEGFAAKQRAVLDAFVRMGIAPTCTCTPYLCGNLPCFGQHLAWSESSAVCFANSVIGARTNREGGPSALAAALTGRTPEHGLHLDHARRPELTVEVEARLTDETDYGALGALCGERIGARVPLFRLGRSATPGLDALKSLSASLATFGGTAIFRIEGVTPEPCEPPAERLVVTDAELEEARAGLCTPGAEVDFVSLGCPHLSLDELRRIAVRLEGRRVAIETWIHLARPLKGIGDGLGYIRAIEAAGAKIACDTCMVVAPITGRFHGLATSSAKCAYYARSKHRLPVLLRPLEDCLRIALGEAPR
jgi:predicted aconitase